MQIKTGDIVFQMATIRLRLIIPNIEEYADKGISYTLKTRTKIATSLRPTLALFWELSIYKLYKSAIPFPGRNSPKLRHISI